MLEIFVAAIIQATPPAPAITIGPWTVRHSSDPVTDVKTASFTIGTPAENVGIGCLVGQPDTVTVQWRGERAFKSASDSIAVGIMIYRLDQDQPSSVMTVLRNREVVSEVYERTAIETIIRRLKSASRLVLRDGADVQPYRTAVFTFTAPQSDALIRRIDADCGTSFSIAPANQSPEAEATKKPY